MRFQEPTCTMHFLTVPPFDLIFGCQALRQGNIFDEVPLFDFIMIKIHDYGARWTPYHLLMLLSRKSQIHNFSEEHSWVYGWCLCKCLHNHNVVESS